LSEYSRRNERVVQDGQQNYRFCSHIGKEEVRNALRKTKTGKAMSLDHIPIEVWKCLGEKGI